MHLEVLKVRLESLKDFAKHYLMIVLSILTALGLEAWIEHAHHRHAAETANAQIAAEIRTNLAEIGHALAQDSRQAKALASVRDALVQDFKAKAADETIAGHIQTLIATKDFKLNLGWPTLRQEAWDVAVANQSAGWIDDAAMRRYSAAYASQREAIATMNANLAVVMNGPRMIDTMTDLRTGDVKPREFLHVVSQMVVTLDQAQDSLATLQQQLGAALAAGSEH